MVLMLDIKDMSEVDKKFYFFKGLKPWAKTELNQQNIPDLASTISVAERLTDYTFERNPIRDESGNGAKRQLPPLHLLSALEKKVTMSKTHTSCTLMYMDLEVNVKLTRVMVNSGVTHNFIHGPEAACLVLSVEEDVSKLKAVNSQSGLVNGVVRNVQTRIREWKGSLNFIVVSLNDFEVISGMEFLR
uniref:Uncharacterized protein n=1 Tax=Kalanchoe fedtschenkoi TaxID=63787 RepID=A0A7N0TZH5_KALFE